jgi:hypothetical protein
VIVVPKQVDKYIFEDGHSWQKHVKDKWKSTLSITLDGVIKICISFILLFVLNREYDFYHEGKQFASYPTVSEDH